MPEANPDARLDAVRARSPRAGLRAAEQALARLAPGRAQELRRATLVRARAHALRALGRHAEAVRDYRRAARLYLRSGAAVEAARCAIGELDALAYLGNAAEARRVARRALHVFGRFRERRAAARLLNNLANLEYRLDRPDRALALYARARRGLHGDRAGLGRVDANRANCFAQRGKPREARALFRRAQRGFARAGRTLDAAGCDYALATLEFVQHRYAEALFSLARLEPTFDRLGAWDYRVLLDLDAAEIYLRLGRPLDAALAAARAEERARAEGLRHETAMSRYFSGVAAAATGEFPEARRQLGSARAIFLRLSNRTRAAQCLLARAECEAAERRWGSAARTAAAAAREFAGTGDRLRQGLAHVVRGNALVAGGRSAAGAIARARAAARAPGASFLGFRLACLEGDAALARDPAAARRAYGRALHIAESLAARVQGELFLSTDWSAWEAAYPRLVALELRHGRPDAVFRALERARASAFERAFGGGSSKALPPRLEARLRALACRLEAPRFGRAAAPAESPLAQHERQAVARELERIERAMGRRRAPTVCGLEEIRSALAPGELALEYFTLFGRVGACAIGAGSIAVYDDLLSESALVSAIEEIRYLSRAVARGMPDSGTALHDALAGLGRALLERPLAEARRLGPEPGHLVVVPSGALVELPWAHMAARVVSVVPSLSFWRRDRAAGRSRAGGNIVLVGLGREDLPAVDEEMARLSTLLPHARVLRGREATVERVRRAIAGADWVHLAGHGSSDDDRPVLSGVRLWDRWAYLPDLVSGPRAARAYVLAACRTGSLHGGFRNDWQGLAGGLLRAGSRVVLASPREADDRGTFELSHALYGHLVRGASLGEALVAARVDRAGTAPDWNASAWTLLGDATTTLSGRAVGGSH